MTYYEKVTFTTHFVDCQLSTVNCQLPKYPTIYFGSDTTGEKAYEEFYVPGETIDTERFHALGVVEKTNRRNMKEIEAFFDEIETIFAKPEFTKAEVVEAIKRFLPNFEHEEKGLNLDSKM